MRADFRRTCFSVSVKNPESSIFLGKEPSNAPGMKTTFASAAYPLSMEVTVTWSRVGGIMEKVRAERPSARIPQSSSSGRMSFPVTWTISSRRESTFFQTWRWGRFLFFQIPVHPRRKAFQGFAALLTTDKERRIYLLRRELPSSLREKDSKGKEPFLSMYWRYSAL